LYSVRREHEIHNFALDPAKDNTGQVQTLRAIFSAPKDPEFTEYRKEGEVSIAGFKKALPYSVWLQKEAAPLAVILPGLGGHRLGSRSLALAEMAFEEGYTVLIFSNTFNWEFMLSAPEGYTPGYFKKDKELQLAAYLSIMDDLKGEYGESFFQKKAILGMSMGAWYALNLAADLTDSGSQELDRCIAINPPVNLLQGLEKLDELYRAPLKNGDMQQAQKIIRSALVKAFMCFHGGLKPTHELPFTDAEASYLIGLSFKLVLRETLVAGLFGHKLNFVACKGDLYEELNSISYIDYYKKIASTKLLENGVSQQQLDDSVNLLKRKDSLMKTKGLHLILSDNDFLVNGEQLNWFKANFEDKMTLFNKGGHLGNLWHPDLQKVIRDKLKIK
ncbi:MAG: alpha/beta hydrolase, partial [Lentisphaeraceae bacterium]|nr:alpha/beta hydrolase [Lentisphaeraceae bacterium]